MKITINKEVFSRLGREMKISFFIIENIDNVSRLDDARRLLKETEELIRMTFHRSSIKNHHLISPWGAAQKAFGEKARHYHTSIENMIYKIMKGQTTAAKNTLENIANYLGLKMIIPFGIDDLSRIRGNITFAIAPEKRKIGFLRSLKAGELYYHDEEKVLGKKLDYWKSPKTRLTPETTSALLHFETLPPVTDKEFKELLREAEALVSSFCSAKVKVLVLDSKNNTKKI